MAETKIEWTATPLPEGADLDWLKELGLKPVEDSCNPGTWLLPGYTFNPWIGCTNWNPGCARCFAADLNSRYGWTQWGQGQPRYRTGATNRRKPLRLNNRVGRQVFERYGIRLKIFCGSLMDWADSEVEEQWRRDLFELISQTPYIDWLLLTKRLEVKPWERSQGSDTIGFYDGFDRMTSILPHGWTEDRWPENVWFGHSVADQASADLILPQIQRLNRETRLGSARKFISYEPAIGPVDWDGWEGQIDLIITGGESGSGSRPFAIEWGTNTLRWCQQHSVGFYGKQLGANPITLAFGGKPTPYALGGKRAGAKGEDVSAWPQALRHRDYLPTVIDPLQAKR